MLSHVARARCRCVVVIATGPGPHPHRRCHRHHAPPIDGVSSGSAARGGQLRGAAAATTKTIRARISTNDGNDAVRHGRRATILGGREHSFAAAADPDGPATPATTTTMTTPLRGEFPSRATSSKSSFSTLASSPSAPSSSQDGNCRDRDQEAASSLIASARGGGYLEQIYETMVQSPASAVQYDVHQIAALRQLDRLRNDLVRRQDERKMRGGGGVQKEETRPSTGSMGDGEEEETDLSPGFFRRLFSRAATATSSTFDAADEPPPRGVYLHGGVGCGKTFCMDLFYDSVTPDRDDGREEHRKTWMGLPVHLTKQKVHFHEFMLKDVHRRMFDVKKVHPKWTADQVLSEVMDGIIQRGRILCFDEFQVIDVADALILRRLFTGLMERGAILVITSNRPPGDLYLGGLQRDLFVPFIDLLEKKLEVVGMWESETDYRLIYGKNRARGVYFVGPDGKADFDAAFDDLTKGSDISPTTITTRDGTGRNVPVPLASTEYGVARFSFDDVCRTATGAADYLAIGQNFHTVFLDDVPNMTMNDVNLVRRFIVFVDAMYECHVKLIVHADEAHRPGDIFEVDLDNKDRDEAFAFDRTRSRLEEMGSEAYLKKRWSGNRMKKTEEEGETIAANGDSDASR